VLTIQTTRTVHKSPSLAVVEYWLEAVVSTVAPIVSKTNRFRVRPLLEAAASGLIRPVMRAHVRFREEPQPDRAAAIGAEQTFKLRRCRSGNR
jgi:hypothetical protein